MDIFPAFTFYASSPKLIGLGRRCGPNWTSYRLKPNPSGSNFNENSCNTECLNRQDCENFVVGKENTEKAGLCMLFIKGCEFEIHTKWDAYEKFDATDM